MSTGAVASLFSREPERLRLPEGDALDALLESLPGTRAVFLLKADQGQQPYLGRCQNLRRRVQRLLRVPTPDSRMLSLRGVARELAFWPVAGRLGAALLLWEQTRHIDPQGYRKRLRLRMPSYVSLLHRNRFPRAVLTRHPANDEWSYGPFPTRADADRFLGQALDLFQIRRCEEELEPHPEHPGCVYGEMGMCLRPCQAAVPDEAYRSEVRSFWAMLETRGESLRQGLEAERDEASANLRFEDAARAHKRLAKLTACFPRSHPLAAPIANLHGVAITKDAVEQSVLLWPVWHGNLQPSLSIAAGDTNGKSIGALLQASRAQSRIHDPETKQELLAVLQRWAGSSWCDGEWLMFDEAEKPPLRKICNAVQRVAIDSVTNAPGATTGEGASHASGNL